LVVCRGAAVLDLEQRLDQRLGVIDAVEGAGQLELRPVERAVAGAEEVPRLDRQGVVGRQRLGLARVVAVGGGDAG
jgi:hypothetical protein